jgi:hypothetical protein
MSILWVYVCFKILALGTLMEDDEKYYRHFLMFTSIKLATGRVLRSLELGSDQKIQRLRGKDLNSLLEVSISLKHQYPTPASASKSAPSSSTACSFPSRKHQ